MEFRRRNQYKTSLNGSKVTRADNNADDSWSGDFKCPRTKAFLFVILPTVTSLCPNLFQPDTQPVFSDNDLITGYKTIHDVALYFFSSLHYY